MNDQQEYRSYGSYLGRVFAIIAAFFLLIFSIWFVVQIASGDNDEDTLGETSTSEVDRSGNEEDQDPDLFVSDSAENGNNNNDATDQNNTGAQNEDGQTLSTNTDTSGNVAGATTDTAGKKGKDKDLPNTGAELNLSILAIGAISYFGTRAYLQRKAD